MFNHFKVLFSKIAIGTVAVALALSLNYLYAWTAPTANPPSGNVSSPLNTSTVAQVKNGGLSVDAFGVFGNAYIQGNLGIGVVSPEYQIDLNGGATGIRFPDGSVQTSAGGSGGLLRITKFTSSGTWTKSADVGHVVVHVVGGGGGAGGGLGSASITGNGQGGGGGGGCTRLISGGSLPSSVAVTVGAGGAGGNGNADGSDGGTSSFGTLCQATGGTGGSKFTSYLSGGTSTGAKGHGGVGSLGDINLRGEAGIYWAYWGASYISNAGGSAAGPYGGAGGAPVASNPTANINGNSADANSGGGGGGGMTVYQSGTSVGGNGGSGVVIVFEYAN